MSSAIWMIIAVKLSDSPFGWDPTNSPSRSPGWTMDLTLKPTAINNHWLLLLRERESVSKLDLLCLHHRGPSINIMMSLIIEIRHHSLEFNDTMFTHSVNIVTPCENAEPQVLFTEISLADIRPTGSSNNELRVLTNFLPTTNNKTKRDESVYFCV